MSIYNCYCFCANINFVQCKMALKDGIYGKKLDKVVHFFNSPIRGIVRKIYYCFSFGFLLARTTAVSLYVASVHDESLLPAPILYSVSGSSYSNEVSHKI